jgi:transcriptional regulator with XRE-family HTH domain
MSAAQATPAREREARLNAAIGAAVRERRLDMGVLQAQLAAHLGLAESSLSRYESGQRTISAAMLCMIAAYLRQPLAAFLPPDQQGPPEPAMQVAALLQRRPELLPAVLGLLETMLEAPISTAAGDA